jgi:hypothetical protein
MRANLCAAPEKNLQTEPILASNLYKRRPLALTEHEAGCPGRGVSGNSGPSKIFFAPWRLGVEISTFQNWLRSANSTPHATL